MTESPQAVKPPPERVLCIDDDSSIRESISAYLSDVGYSVETAPNGDTGLKILEHTPFDAVLLDLSMPGVSGLEVLDQTTRSHPTLPVIVISGTGNVHDVIAALRLGAWDFLTKPIEDLDLLHYVLRRSVERSRLRQENERYRLRLESLVEERTLALSEEVRERRLAEEALRKSLHEKEVLLKEVHHRVKNNLQVVSSLLSLQALRHDDPRLNECLLDSQTRVRAMALVHEKLYNSEDLSRVDLGSYLDRLTHFLLQTYSHTGLTITPDIACDPVSLPVDTAIPCGLILNELISNCLKHAFSDRGEGVITLRLLREGEMINLRVDDNGKGLPQGFQLGRVDTLGLQLVYNLTQQLKASLHVAGLDPGTSFQLSFRHPEPPAA
ncbi:histidine kinase dimerization/phosphoacceptor domain -containing protein [Fundidesulfovibrio soli]|uniref:histidine kinase dimerization/phosphoacceptor domain -containing protein n=1 Tax=Fundidesulfovibrio soli TaxID=2922716 RepID=UPI001FAF52B6|nr:histidine kinase dimerization/phosphoacceptor domain -containing protein [Fundidesulfovibrio soli]